MGKTFKHSTKRVSLAAMAGIALVATSALAQPPREEHGGAGPRGGGQQGGQQGGQPRGGGGAPAAPGGMHGNGGGGGGGGNPGAAPQAARPAPQQQAAPAQQAPRPQQNFGGGGQRPEGRPGGQFNGQPGGQPGGPRGDGNRFEGNRGGDNRGPEVNRGPNGGGFNNGNAQRGPNWGPGASGQPRQGFANQRPWDERRAGPGGGGNYRAWNNDWRRDNRYDWRGWRDSHRDVYRLGQYNAPYRNYAYRRLSIGFRLDPLFYGNGYMIYDPQTYRLPDAYGPYRWVRYYNDAVLVDTYTGQVVDVMYGFFW